MMADTLRIDTNEVSRWIATGDYNYQRDLTTADESAWGWLKSLITRNLSDLANSAISDDTEFIIKVGCTIATLLFLLWIVCRVRPHIFSRESLRENYQVEEDNIYGIPFDSLIQQAQQQGNHRELVRLIYLRTLRTLSDTHHIEWQPSKTPAQYAREYASQPFRQMSQLFLLVRYGNQTANADMAQQMAQGEALILQDIDKASRG